jgi:glycosyltransferase involved in cell wall biosynthesis
MASISDALSDSQVLGQRESRLRLSSRTNLDSTNLDDESPRLRVAFVTDTIAGRLGGGVVAGHYLVNALRQRHDVRVIASDASGDHDVRVDGFMLPIQAMREAQFTMARPDRAKLSAAFADVDLVHVQFPFWLSMVAVEEAQKAGKPVVAAFHVQPENLLYNVGIHSTMLNRLTYRLWIRSVFNRADAVVCPTSFAKRKLAEHGLTAPAYVVSNGVPLDVRDGAVSARSRDDGKFMILATGRLAAEKRQDVIIEAVRRSQHRDRIRLVLAGAGPREEELRALGAELPNPPEMGFVTRARLVELLNTADLFVHASEVELEGIAVLEAMSAGLPVLVSGSSESAASEFALSDDFRFASGDPGDLARKIDALIESPAALEVARDRYRAKARVSDFATSVRSVEDIYRRVLISRGLETARTA